MTKIKNKRQDIPIDWRVNECGEKGTNRYSIWHDQKSWASHNTHKSWTIFSPSGLSDKQTLKMNDIPTVAKFNAQHRWTNNKQRQRQMSQHACLCEWQSGWKSENFVRNVLFYREKIFYLELVCIPCSSFTLYDT